MTDRDRVEARRREVDMILADDRARRGREHEDWCDSNWSIGCDCGLGCGVPFGDPHCYPRQPSVFDGIARGVA